MKVIIINGPNLNLLGVHEPEIYGSLSIDAFLSRPRESYPNCAIDYYRGSAEGKLISKLQKTGFSYDGIILDAGTYTHTSIALLDCIRSLQTLVIEVHISNVNGREDFRRRSMTTPACKETIQGFGLNSHRLAIGVLSLL